jgi:ABC-2 type transport system ATP-binding protein
MIAATSLSKSYVVYQKADAGRHRFASSLRRTRKVIEAVRGVSFSVGEREIVGFIGPNGAGKTTTLKMLSGLVHPSSGEVSVLGRDPTKREPQFLREIGFVMGQRNQLWWDLPPMDSYELLIDIYEVERSSTRRMVLEWAERLGIMDCVKAPVRTLSLGQRMKAEFLAGILHRPKVLFLDEPTVGLDLVSANEIRRMIAACRDDLGASVILTSHNMTDIEWLCRRTIIIRGGTIVYDGPLSDCYERFMMKKRVAVKTSVRLDRGDLPSAPQIVEKGDFEVVWEVDRDLVRALSAELMSRYRITEVAISELPIDRAIEAIYGGAPSNA